MVKKRHIIQWHAYKDNIAKMVDIVNYICLPFKKSHQFLPKYRDLQNKRYISKPLLELTVALWPSSDQNNINGSVLCDFWELSLKGGMCSLPLLSSAGWNADVIARARADILDHNVEATHWGHWDSKIEGDWVSDDLWNFLPAQNGTSELVEHKKQSQ